MAKSVFISILEKDEARGQGLYDIVTRYGLGVNGHFWSDNLEKMEWAGPVDEICRQEIGVWLIKGTLESFKNPDIRFGLAMLAASIQANRGQNFPIICICDDGELNPADLPTPLQGIEVVSEEKLGPKLVAKANIPIKKSSVDYRFIPHPLPGLGLWLEVGPAKTHNWAGAMLGVAGGDIFAHGVGEAETIPNKCVLNYPVKGLKLALADKEFNGWAVKNELDQNQSYYVKVTDNFDTLLFGEFSEGDDAECFIIAMK
ncbi:MAG: hypothetical protein OCC45_09890 [Desulfotalea sp.]